MNNLEIYEKYRSVPKEALKDFNNGKFKGTDINSVWRIKCLTEQFGAVGIGWTTKVVRTWTEQCANNEVLAFAEIEMRICVDGKWSEPFTATGGNKLVKYVKAKDGKEGYYDNNDEAYKMAITDAFGVACKYLGIGADVYWANDKSKYNDEPKQDKPFDTKEKDKITLDEAKAYQFTSKGITYVVGELDDEKLVLLKDTKLPDLREAVNVVLEDRAKKAYGKGQDS